MAADADVLYKKGKRFAAAFLQQECIRSTNSPLLNELLDILLDPEKTIDSWDTIDWCRWLMAGGKTPDEYAQTVRRYDNATTCGLVWTANFVAFRCRTCGISPCMSLCAECFLQGNHEDHDYNMFRSQAGGACDCGDTSVMKESGFCLKHGPKAQNNKPQVPPDLLCIAEALMPRLILRLIQHLRQNSLQSREYTAIQEADGFLTMLHQLSELGGAMRKVMTQALSNPQVYHNLAIECFSSNPDKVSIMKENYLLYLNAKDRLINFEFPEEYHYIKALQPELKHTTFLEELMFWTVRYEFPQKLVCFLLNMLPDSDYKVAFTQTFVHHYSRITVMLAHSSSADALSNRVVHVSVQLFSNENLTLHITQELQLLHVMVISLKAMMSSICQPHSLQVSEKNLHCVVDCSHSIMKEHCYWPLVCDLNNVLTHRPVALEFLKDPKLLDMWFSFLLMFQGMNVNKRELREHVEFEPNTYYAAFLAELEASATPMWALISHLQGPDMLHLTKQVIFQCLTSLEDWFDAIGFTFMDVPNPYQVSFHLPLHRYISIFLYQAVCQQGASLKELMPSQEMLKMMLFHPLQVQVAFQEILSGMWVRNGLQIKGQAMTYIQCHFCTSLVDADIFLLQLCAGGLDPDLFLRTVLQRFQVWEWLSFKEPSKTSYLDPEQIMPMLEGALTFLATIMDIHTNMGLTEEEITRKEMISLLCMNNRTHSQLMELLPEKCGTNSQNKDFESILSQIADYKAPNFEAGGNMWQGMYAPKAEIWENEYDPIHTLLRAVHRRDFQASVDRYTQYIRQASKYQGSGSPWLPYRIPGKVHKEFNDPRRVLQCKTFHAVALTILFRALSNTAITEQILSLCIYLLDMAVRFSTPISDDSLGVPNKTKDEVPDMDYQEWFPSGNNTLVNLWQVVHNVVVPQTIEMTTGLVEEMDVDIDFDEVDNDQAMIQALQSAVYQVQSPGGDDSGDERSIGQEQSQHQHSQPLVMGPSSIPLALLPSTASPSSSPSTSPSSSSSTTSNTALVPMQPNMVVAQTSLMRSDTTLALPAVSMVSADESRSVLQPYLLHPALELPSTSNSTPDENMAIVPTPIGPARIRPRCLKLRRIPGRHHVMLTSKQNLCVAGKAPFKALPYLRPTQQVDESIVSMLLQLHSRFSGKIDSYQPPTSIIGPEVEHVRLGDGVTFIQLLLDRIVTSQGATTLSLIQELREQLWPQQKTAQEVESMKVDGQDVPVDKEERRRRAKERQQKLMAEFASKQKAFMEQTMKTEEDADGTDMGGPDSLLDIAKEYECIICGQTTPSTLEKPIGMVVLVQATSVLGHAHEDKPEFRKLPCSDEERLTLKSKCRLGAYNERRLEEMARFFDSSSWQLALNIGWDGGVHVQSCGHYLHIDCHKSYIQSLRSQTHQNQRLNLAVDRGEYLCPLCRQLANSVLPINPDMGEASALVRCHHNQLTSVAKELAHLFTVSPEEVSLILKKMADIVEDLTLATFPQYRAYCSPDSHSLYLFVCSIVRTNLEIELLLRRGNLCSSAIKKSCFVPLFHVLACHAKVLARVCFVQCWSQMSGLPLEDHMSSLTPVEQEVPVLLRDVSTLLIQMILSLPLHVDKAYYSCVIQVLYNLAYVQAVAQVSCRLNLQQRLSWKEHSKAAQGQLRNLGVVLGTVVDHLEHSNLYLDDEDLDVDLRNHEWSEVEVEKDIQYLCLPFLRIASLLQAHLYSQDLPITKDTGDEYSSLCKFLCLSQPNSTSSAAHLEWASPEPLVVVRTWCQDFINFVNRSLIASRTLLDRPLKWYPPALLRLPKNYNRIFQYYHRRMCLVCHSVPKDPSMCLVCGTLVCLRENCCRQQSHSEAVTHSVSCGAGTALYLAVNSSTIVVIRGKRACLWGSVYLDKFGEEDRDLKRGKPLYLSEDRYQLLEQQWLSHSFDHTNKRWVWHRDNL